MSSDLIGALVDASAAAITTHARELTELDAAIGDGDHGLNMKRGFDALLASRDELCALSLEAALQKAGMTLVMKVGGASGPLYGSALMAMGKSTGGAVDKLQAAVAAVQARGKSQAGEKTMLDVLVPVLAALADGGDRERVRQVATDAVAATRDMLATKGRASFLGERSIGHIDPGARSSCLLVHVVCDVLEAQQ